MLVKLLNFSVVRGDGDGLKIDGEDVYTGELGGSRWFEHASYGRIAVIARLAVDFRSYRVTLFRQR